LIVPEVEVIIVMTGWNIAEHPDVDPYVTLQRILAGHAIGNNRGRLASTPLAGWANRDYAEQARAGDGLQLTLRFSFQPRLSAGVRPQCYPGAMLIMKGEGHEQGLFCHPCGIMHVDTDSGGS
jgi:hypothetical protein